VGALRTHTTHTGHSRVLKFSITTQCDRRRILCMRQITTGPLLLHLAHCATGLQPSHSDDTTHSADSENNGGTRKGLSLWQEATAVHSLLGLAVCALPHAWSAAALQFLVCAELRSWETLQVLPPRHQQLRFLPLHSKFGSQVTL